MTKKEIAEVLATEMIKAKGKLTMFTLRHGDREGALADRFQACTLGHHRGFLEGVEEAMFALRIPITTWARAMCSAESTDLGLPK